MHHHALRGCLLGDPGHSVLRSLLACLTLAATAACAPQLDEEIWWDGPPVIEAEVSVGNLILADTIDLPPDFSRVVQAAFVDSSRIALVDLADCHVWIASLDGYGSRLNQTCGGGPGELVRPVTATSDAGGRLLVIDGGTGSAVIHGPDLVEVARAVLPGGIAAEYSYSASAWVGDSFALSIMAAAGPEIPPDSPRAALGAIVGLGANPGWRAVAGHLPRITSRLETNSGAIAVSCSAPAGDALLIVNPWAFEVMLLPHGEASDARYFAWRLEGDGHATSPAAPANPVSRVVASGIACGETSYLVTQVHSASPELRDGSLTVRREIRTYEGEVLFRALSSGPEAGPLWLPVAGDGERFFLTSSDDQHAGFVVRLSEMPAR
jgi:hypothetical protein